MSLHTSGLMRRPDTFVEGEVKQWCRDRPGGPLNAPDFRADRFTVALASPETLFDAFLGFVDAVERQSKTGGLFVFNEPAFYAESTATAQQATDFLTRQMQALEHETGRAGAARGAVHIGRIVAECPVTGRPTPFDDFRSVVLCPQAANSHDPQRDPKFYAPYPCVHLSSRSFSVAHHVRDLSLLLFGEDVHRLKDRTMIDEVFAVARDYAPGFAAGLFDRWRAHFGTAEARPEAVG